MGLIAIGFNASQCGPRMEIFYNYYMIYQGPDPRRLVARQLLGLLGTLFSRSSHCRRQMSRRPTRREKYKRREWEI
jgi:hypothetical protein